MLAEPIPHQLRGVAAIRIRSWKNLDETSGRVFPRTDRRDTANIPGKLKYPEVWLYESVYRSFGCCLESRRTRTESRLDMPGMFDSGIKIRGCAGTAISSSGLSSVLSLFPMSWRHGRHCDALVGQDSGFIVSLESGR